MHPKLFLLDRPLALTLSRPATSIEKLAYAFMQFMHPMHIGRLHSHSDTSRTTHGYYQSAELA
jgi:hypothetical protein